MTAPGTNAKCWDVRRCDCFRRDERTPDADIAESTRMTRCGQCGFRSEIALPSGGVWRSLSPNSIQRHQASTQCHPTFSNEGEQGTRRLTALEKICDPISQRHLDAIGIQPGWRCLEIGAGTGSMATYLAKLVRQRGSVLATDIDTRFLNGLEESTLGNIEVRQHDIMSDPLHERGF